MIRVCYFVRRSFKVFYRNVNLLSLALLLDINKRTFVDINEFSSFPRV